MKGPDREQTLSHLSSYSVIVFAVALFIAVGLDIAFPFKLFPEPWNQYFGVFIVGAGTYIIYWAEFHGKKFSNRRRRGEVVAVDHLKNVPYSHSRNPKYIGLGVLLIGLGIILNSIFVVAASFISILFIHFFLLQKEEGLMNQRHGELYEEYKKRVKKWL